MDSFPQHHQVHLHGNKIGEILSALELIHRKKYNFTHDKQKKKKHFDWKVNVTLKMT